MHYNTFEQDVQITFIHGLAGSTAALLSTTILYPLENIKTRMQVIRTNPKKLISRPKRDPMEHCKTMPEEANGVKSLDRFRHSRTSSVDDPSPPISSRVSPKKGSPKPASPQKSKLKKSNTQVKESPIKSSPPPLKSPVERQPSPSSLLKMAVRKNMTKGRLGTVINPALSVKVENPIVKERRLNSQSSLLAGRFMMQKEQEEKPEETKQSLMQAKRAQRSITSMPCLSDCSPKLMDSGEDKTPKKPEEIQKPPKQDSTMWELFKEILRKEGVQGLYKGISPLLIGNFISYGVYFFWYEALKKYLKIRTNDILGYSKIAFFSGIITTTCSHPFWVINAKMTLQKENQGTWQVISKILDNEGLPGFFKGLWTSLTMVLNPIIQFSIYEYIKNALKASKNQTLVYFFGGAVSKALATILTYPYQVIRTNIHISKKTVKLEEIFNQIYSNGGFHAFFKGLSPKMYQTVLNSAFLLVFYEKIFYFFLMLIFKPRKVGLKLKH